MSAPHRIALALVFLAGAGTCALAQNTKMRPGLWEVQAHVKSSSGQMEAALAQMQEQLAGMPPEQRRQMQEMMAARGINPSNAGQSARICMTQKDVDMDRVQSREGCTYKNSRSGANTLHINFQCKGVDNEAPSSGEGTITFDGPTMYSGQFKVKTTRDGKPEEMTIKQQGKWQSAHCGSVKPITNEQ